jgi:hypothetical protein
MTLKDELFGMPKEEAYKKFASEINGKFSRGDFYNPVKVEVPFKNWTITLDTNVTKELLNNSGGNPYGGNSEYTRVRAPFIKSGNFHFAISNTGAFDSFTKLFGAQDITTGDEKFDDSFTIKGSDENRIQHLFSNTTIRHLLMELGEVHLMTREQEGLFGIQLPSNVNELFFKAEDVLIEPGKLKLLIELFSEILDQLCSIGCAKADNPNIDLA